MNMVEKMARAYWLRWQAEWAAIMPLSGEPIPSWDFAPMAGREATMRCMVEALKAMREPTPRMCDMGEGSNLRCGCPQCDHEAWEKVAAGYTAMIDEAISEAGE